MLCELMGTFSCQRCQSFLHSFNNKIWTDSLILNTHCVGLRSRPILLQKNILPCAKQSNLMLSNFAGFLFCGEGNIFECHEDLAWATHWRQSGKISIQYGTWTIQGWRERTSMKHLWERMHYISFIEKVLQSLPQAVCIWLGKSPQKLRKVKLL